MTQMTGMKKEVAEGGSLPVTILYFAWLRERMGKAGEVVSLPDGVATLGGLMAWLGVRDEVFLNARLIRAAVNQEFAAPGTPVAPGDEIAFFPPVTGG